MYEPWYFILCEFSQILAYPSLFVNSIPFIFSFFHSDDLGLDKFFEAFHSH
jgi:hypothetical protein